MLSSATFNIEDHDFLADCSGALRVPIFLSGSCLHDFMLASVPHITSRLHSNPYRNQLVRFLILQIISNIILLLNGNWPQKISSSTKCFLEDSGSRSATNGSILAKLVGAPTTQPRMGVQNCTNPCLDWLGWEPECHGWGWKGSV